MAIDCYSIRQAVSDHFLSHVDAQQVRDVCVVTVPFATVDNRWVDVFIEPRATDFFLIHDGGKALNELIIQGMKITPSVEQEFSLIAERFDIAYSDEMFQTGAKLDKLAQRVSVVGMSSALAMTQLLGYVPAVVQDSLDGQIGVLLRRWSRRRAQVRQSVRVDGALKQHTFDFVVTPRKPGRTAAFSILNPSAGALSAAERFGFKTQDLAHTDCANWRRVAIASKAEVWSREARRLVDKCASAVVEVNSGQQPTYEEIDAVLSRAA